MDPFTGRAYCTMGPSLGAALLGIVMYPWFVVTAAAKVVVMLADVSWEWLRCGMRGAGRRLHKWRGRVHKSVRGVWRSLQGRG